jgi:hypothetical protein
MYKFTGLLGVVAIATPYLLGFQDVTAAFWTTVVTGVLLIGLAILEGFARDRDDLEYWAVSLVGLGAITAPFVLNFNETTAALWTTIAIGVLAVATTGYRFLAPPTET